MRGKMDINKTIRFDEKTSEYLARVAFMLDVDFPKLVRTSLAIAIPLLLHDYNKTLLKMMDVSDVKVSNLSVIDGEAR